MKVLTPQQTKHLEWAVRAGLLDSDLAKGALSWGKRQGGGVLLAPRELVRPHHSLEANAARLNIQISRRELEILLKEGKSPAIDRQVQIKHLLIASYEADYKALTGQSLVAPPVSPPTPAVVTLALDPREQAQRDAVLVVLGMAEDIGSIAIALEGQKTLASHSPIRRFGMPDASLCMAWTDVQLDDSIEFWEATSVVDSVRRCLVYSARTAELAAQSYYRALGYLVEDVSAQQLDGQSKDWMTFDIRAGQRCIDVKNARHALHGPGHFVEHCVPRFKKDRTSSQDVAILGVLSDYISSPEDYVDLPQTVRILGEVTIDELRSIYRWSRARFGADLDLQGLWKPQHVAGWLFEYPSEHYPGRIAAIQSIQPLLRRMKSAGARGTEVPGWMLVLCEDDSAINDFVMGEARRAMLHDLRAIQVAVGLSRRSLYVYALGLTLECLKHKTTPREDLATLLSLLKISAPWGSGATLLGLRDPQAYVEHLVETLTEIGQAVLDKGLELTGFKLTHPAIVLGTSSSGRTTTLLAYCGGWQSTPFTARCGKAPLTLAKHSHCPSCGHLICDNCGHCSHICPACQSRQDRVAGSSLHSEEETEPHEPPDDWEDQAPESWDPYRF